MIRNTNSRIKINNNTDHLLCLMIKSIFSICQRKKYIEKIVGKFNMADAKGHMCHPKVDVPYASAIYVIVATRSNIANIVGVVTWFMANPSKAYWDAVVKTIMKYLKVTKTKFICYG